MNYQIIPQDDTVLVQITEAGKSETLNMQEGPQEGSLLVESCRKDVLEEINTEKFLANLDNYVDLVQITFNAVDGLKVQSQVKVLSNRFFDAMTKCNILGLECKLETSSVLDTYLNAYECLFNGDVEIAVSLLADTRIYVDKMEKQVDELITTFDELTAYTNKVLQEVIEESNADGAKQNETKVIVMDLKDSAKEIENLRENLQKYIVEYEADYKRQQQCVMTQENRPYNMQMSSMLLGAVSGIFGVNDISQSTKEEREQEKALAKRMDAIGEKRDLIKKKEHENLVKLAEYIAEMKPMVMDKKPLESAMQSLAIAVGCLQNVQGYLHEMKRFWENAKVACENLCSDKEINTMIELQRDKELEQNAAYFKTILFVRGYAEILAKWKALEVVFTEYRTAIIIIDERMAGMLEQSVYAERKEQWHIASRLVGELNARLR